MLDVRSMPSIIDAALDRYTQEHSRTPGPLYDELAKVTREKTTAPGMQIGPVEGAFLRLLVQLSGARRVLEVGTFTGYSALCIAEALPEGGELITCDIDPDAVAIAQSFWDRSPHGKKIRSVLGKAADTIGALPKDHVFDLVFLDADKAAYITYYELALPLVRQGGLIVADNALWSGAVLDPKTEDDRGIDAYNTHVNKDPRVDNVLLSVRDGIMVARKL